MARQKTEEKIKKRGIKKAIIFFEDPDTGLTRMVTFGEIDEMLDTFWEASEMWFERVRKLIKESYGRDLTKIEWEELIDGTAPDFIKAKNKYLAGEKIRFNMDYWVK